MKTRYLRRRREKALRPLFIREDLAPYDVGRAAEEIPYREQYRQFLLTERGCKPQTAGSNLNMLGQFSRFLEAEYGLQPFRPEEVTPAHLRRYLAYLKNERGNGPATRNGKLSMLGSYYFFLECCGLMDENDNPLRLVRRAREPARLPLCLTREEAERLLETAASGPDPLRDTALLRVLLQAGLRPIELTALRAGEVDFAQQCLLVPGKGEQQRLVPLTKKTASALRAYLEEDPRNPSEHLFVSVRGKPLTTTMLNLWFKKLCRGAGIEKAGLTVRNLRHTCLTLLLQEGADLMALKKLAGHKRISTTQRYLHVTQNQLRQAIKKHPLG